MVNINNRRPAAETGFVFSPLGKGGRVGRRDLTIFGQIAHTAIIQIGKFHSLLG